jgi:hypothetical protein
MLNCEETSRLISLSREQNIGFWKKFQIKAHISMCDGCYGFYNLVKKTRQILKNDSEKKIPADMLNEIRNNLKD